MDYDGILPTRCCIAEPRKGWWVRLSEETGAAEAEVLSKRVLDLLLTATEADLIYAEPQAETVKGTAKPPGGWMHAPAYLQLFALADRRLTTLARASGMSATRVAKVQASLIGDSRLLLLRPAGSQDLTAFPVIRYARRSGAWVNLYDLLGPKGITVESGYRVRFDIAYVPKESLLRPGLVIDLDQPKERRLERPGKKDGSQTTETKS